MELINLKSSKIKNYSSVSATMSINGNVVSLSSAVVKEFGLKAGQFVHFMNDGREWSFIANDDPDGFRLQKENRTHRNGLKIFNAALCNLFKRSLQIKEEDMAKYYLTITDRIYKDCRVIEVLTSKPIDKIGK
jgi:hypothetical protein